MSGHAGVSQASLSNEFPVLDIATAAALRASIERFGVLVAVVHDQHGRVLDGHHRSRIADALGIDYGVTVLEVHDDDHARELARELNLVRRHLTPEQRKAVVTSLREDGHSTRAIAGAVGVDAKTVRNDLAASGGEKSPPAVTGRDGKTYPARTRRRTKPAPAEIPLYVRFTRLVTDTTDVLEHDAWRLAAAVPDAERENWASHLRALAGLATAAAERLTAETTT